MRRNTNQKYKKEYGAGFFVEGFRVVGAIINKYSCDDVGSLATSSETPDPN
jgi:hypothetical protein